MPKKFLAQQKKNVAWNEARWANYFTYVLGQNRRGRPTRWPRQSSHTATISAHAGGRKKKEREEEGVDSWGPLPVTSRERGVG